MAATRPSRAASRTSRERRARPHSARPRSRPVLAATATFGTIGLEELTAAAALQTRVDRKYIVPFEGAAGILAGFAGKVLVLEEDRRRAFAYDSVYFDTPGLEAYLLAAHGRRRRYKVRTRTYLEGPTAALASRADITIAGNRSLEVNGTVADGIATSDGLVLAGGTVTIDAADEGIRGKDYVAVLGGDYTVASGGDGVRADNEEDATRGWTTVAGGGLHISAGDDGLKAATVLTIEGGEVQITESNQGVEGQHIAITGGSADVTATDDGVNASGGSTADSGTADAAAGGLGGPGGGMGGRQGGAMEVGDFPLDISGGTLTVTSRGDGLDSNGTGSVSGGGVVVNGPTTNGNGAIDGNGGLVVTGGTIAAAGSAGMAEARTSPRASPGCTSPSARRSRPGPSSS